MNLDMMREYEQFYKDCGFDFSKQRSTVKVGFDPSYRIKQEAEANKRQISDNDMNYLTKALEAPDVNAFLSVI